MLVTQLLAVLLSLVTVSGFKFPHRISNHAICANVDAFRGGNLFMSSGDGAGAINNVGVVLLAGGKGTRMQPFSTKYPKPILPILNRPLMVHQIEQMVNEY